MTATDNTEITNDLLSVLLAEGWFQGFISHATPLIGPIFGAAYAIRWLGFQIITLKKNHATLKSSALDTDDSLQTPAILSVNKQKNLAKYYEASKLSYGLGTYLSYCLHVFGDFRPLLGVVTSGLFVGLTTISLIEGCYDLHKTQKTLIQADLLATHYETIQRTCYNVDGIKLNYNNYIKKYLATTQDKTLQDCPNKQYWQHQGFFNVSKRGLSPHIDKELKSTVLTEEQFNALPNNKEEMKSKQDYQAAATLARHDRNTAATNLGLVCLGLTLTVLWGFCPPGLIATVICFMAFTAGSVAYKYIRKSQKKALAQKNNVPDPDSEHTKLLGVQNSR